MQQDPCQPADGQRAQANRETHRMPALTGILKRQICAAQVDGPWPAPMRYFSHRIRFASRGTWTSVWQRTTRTV